jgi:hypothetical protein
MDSIHDAEWVKGRLDALNPAWTPDLAAARHRMSVRPAERDRRVFYGALAAAALLTAIAIAPSGRAFAQELWARLFVNRVAVVQMDLSDVPLDGNVHVDGGPIEVASLAAATERAGFQPVLPPADAVDGSPRFAVLSSMVVTQTIHVSHLEQALQRIGAIDLKVPARWEGVTLKGTIGPLVFARYPGDIELLQAQPVRLDLPAHFDLARFLEIVFRVAGLDQPTARTLALQYAERPAILLDMPEDEAATVETIRLPHGDALLIDDPNDEGGSRVTVVVSRPQRIYSVSGPAREAVERLARALP